MKKQHSKSWGGSRPNAGRKVKLSEEMIRVTQRYIERLSEGANDPNLYIYQLFTADAMPAVEVKSISLADAKNLVASQRGWHEAKLES